ncbi:MAG: hypothetical protein L7V86_19410 [Verrucomicrobiales bacterium]|nr:hypothetical protein [Verrucomicrobiales bacterium]
MKKEVNRNTTEYKQSSGKRHQTPDETVAAIQSQIGWLTLLEVLVGEERGRELFNKIVVGSDLRTV